MKHTGYIAALLLSTGSALGAPDETPDLSEIQPVKIKAAGSLQFRYTTSLAPDAPDPVDDPAIGFSFRRLRGKMSATVGDFKVNLQVGAASGTASLLDLSVDYSPAEDWRIRFGQFKPAFSREQMVSSTQQLAVDRSSTSNSINPVSGGRVQGIELRWQGSSARVTATISEGSRSINTDFTSESEGMGAILRFEHLLMGESFLPFSAMTAPRETPESLLFGAAGWYQQLDSGGDRAAWTADLSYMNSGFGLMLAGGGHVAEDRNLGSSPEPESAYGALAQAGVYVSGTVEPFVRYEWGTTSSMSHPDLNVITAGVNWYIHGQALKFVADASIGLDGVGPVFDRGSDGLLATPAGAERFVLRAQVQVLF